MDDACQEIPGCVPGGCSDNSDCGYCEICSSAGNCISDPDCLIGGCTSNDDCNDGNACTYDFCGTDGSCGYAPVSCIDTDPCTSDSCDSSIGCVHEVIPGCVSCSDDSDCDDGDICTDDSCGDDGSCSHNFIPGCVPCEDDFDCGDGDPCTNDVCSSGGCDNILIEDCTGCMMDSDCNDGDECTDDSCEGDGSCRNLFNNGPGCYCEDDFDCNDGDICTTDVCNFDGSCSHNPISGCVPEGCSEDSDCDDSNVCNGNEFCDDGVCKSGTPLDCDDGDVCTSDSCDSLSGCEHDRIEGCCEEPCYESSESSCPAGYNNPDSKGFFSFFIEYFISLFRIAKSGDSSICCCPNDCESDSDCDDGDVCTDDSCGDYDYCDYEEKDCEGDDACKHYWCDPDKGCQSKDISHLYPDCGKNCDSDFDCSLISSLCADSYCDISTGKCKAECNDGVVCSSGGETCTVVCDIQDCDGEDDGLCSHCECKESSSKGSGEEVRDGFVDWVKSGFGGGNIRTKYETSCVYDMTDSHFGEVKIKETKYKVYAVLGEVIPLPSQTVITYKDPNECQTCGSYDHRGFYVFDITNKRISIEGERNHLNIPRDFAELGFSNILSIPIQNYDEVEHPVEVWHEVLDGKGDIVKKEDYDDILEVEIGKGNLEENKLYNPRYTDDVNNIKGIIPDRGGKEFEERFITYAVKIKGYEDASGFELCGTNYVRITVRYPGMKYVKVLTIHKSDLVDKYLEEESEEVLEPPVLYEIVPKIPHLNNPQGYKKSGDSIFDSCTPQMGILGYNPDDCKKDTYMCRFGECRHLCGAVRFTDGGIRFPAIETIYDFNRYFENSKKVKLIEDFKHLDKSVPIESKMLRNSAMKFVTHSCVAVDAMTEDMSNILDQIVFGDTGTMINHYREGLPLIMKPLSDIISLGMSEWSIAWGYAGRGLSGSQSSKRIFMQIVYTGIDGDQMRGKDRVRSNAIFHETAHLLHHKLCDLFSDSSNIIGCKFNKKWRKTYKPDNFGILQSFDIYFKDNSQYNVCIEDSNKDLWYRKINPAGNYVPDINNFDPNYGLIRPYGGYAIYEDIATYVESMSCPNGIWGYKDPTRIKDIDWNKIFRVRSDSEFDKLFTDVTDPKGVYIKKVILLYEAGFISKEQVNCILKNSGIVPNTIREMKELYPDVTYP